MSMLGAVDNEPRSYLEIADALRLYGAKPREDLEQLWRRIVFEVLINNTDDHLRNHGFLYQNATGWVLSPAYDLNPMPVDLAPRGCSCSRIRGGLAPSHCKWEPQWRHRLGRAAPEAACCLSRRSGRWPRERRGINQSPFEGRASVLYGPYRIGVAPVHGSLRRRR